MLPDYYQLLGVEMNADLSAIKQAYRRQIAQHHPDKQGSDEQALLLNMAYETLKNPAKRASYDAKFVQFHRQRRLYQAGQRLYHSAWQLGHFAKTCAKKLWQHLPSSPILDEIHAQNAGLGVCVIDLCTAYQGGVVLMNGQKIALPKGLSDGDVIDFGVEKFKIHIRQKDIKVHGKDVHYLLWLDEKMLSCGLIDLPKPWSLQLKLPVNTSLPASITLSGRGIDDGQEAGDLMIYFNAK